MIHIHTEQTLLTHFLQNQIISHPCGLLQNFIDKSAHQDDLRQYFEYKKDLQVLRVTDF